MSSEQGTTDFYKNLQVWKVFSYIFITLTACFFIAFIYWVVYYYSICIPTWTCKKSCKCVNGEPVPK